MASNEKETVSSKPKWRKIWDGIVLVVFIWSCFSSEPIGRSFWQRVLPEEVQMTAIYPYIPYVTWPIGVIYLFTIFWHDRSLAKNCGKKIYWGPRIIAVGFMLLFLCNGVQIRSSKIKDINTYRQTRYDSPPPDPEGNFSYSGTKAWIVGDYAYCVLFFDRQSQDYPEPASSWQSNRILWYAAKLAQNPTSEGYQEFTNNVNAYSEEISDQIKVDRRKTPLCFNYIGAVRDAQTKLSWVEKRLPKEKRGLVESVRQKVIKLYEDKIKSDPDWWKE
jgi:hypothetical protein